jgi:hypothetical protein
VAVRVAVDVGVKVGVDVDVIVEVAVRVKVAVDVSVGDKVRVVVAVLVRVGVKVAVAGIGMICRASTTALVSVLDVPVNWIVITPPLGETLLYILSSTVSEPTCA